MELKLLKFIVLTMQAEYNKNILEEIKKLLKEFYQAKEVNYIIDSDINLEKNNSLFIPIYVNSRIHSYYEICDFENCKDYTLIEYLSIILSQMYSNIMYYNSKVLPKEYDISTNTFNRNSFEIFKNNFSNLEYENITCIYIDINGLNEINNAYGHRQGDKVILKVANSIKETFNEGDVYRVGGDEFVIMLLNREEDKIYKEAYKLKEMLNNDNIYISIGINHKTEVSDIEKFVDEADKRMFEDKQTFYKMHSKTLRKKYYK